MTEFDIEDLFVEPRPDEDAWEAFVDLALERIGGERSSGLTNRQIGELEAVLGCQLPFEAGLMLVIGVPKADGWHQWENPAADYAAWTDTVRSGICFDVEHNNFWRSTWGEKPDALQAQLTIARDLFDTTVPALFPLYRQHAMPLVAAEGQPNSDGNPVFSIDRTNVELLGDDLAAWMHREFDVPLPMWPAEPRTFDFWTELANTG